MKKIENAPKLKEMLEKLLCEYVHDNIGGIAERIAVMVSHEPLVSHEAPSCLTNETSTQPALLKFETIRYANILAV